jgi:hypothetical protein
MPNPRSVRAKGSLKSTFCSMGLTNYIQSIKLVPEISYLLSICDRNSDIQVGLEYGSKPKIWRVYERKRAKGKNSNDVAGILHGMHETHLYN